MAKSRKFKKPDPVVKKIFPPQKGMMDGDNVTLAHNPITDRYDLRVGDELRYSGPHQMCLAHVEGVEWE